MERLCRIVGHSLKNTLIINDQDGFYEVEDAKYCQRCGEVNPATKPAISRYIGSLI